MFIIHLLLLLVSKLLLCWCDSDSESQPQSQSRRKSQYYMKPVDNEGELFFTDATNFDEAFRI